MDEDEKAERSRTDGELERAVSRSHDGKKPAVAVHAFSYTFGVYCASYKDGHTV